MKQERIRPALLLEALRHLNYAGLVATTANHAGYDLMHRRYWRAPTFFFSSRRRHTRSKRDWSSDVCSSDLPRPRGRRARNLLRFTAPRRPERSEERRVGKECRSRRSPYHQTKKHRTKEE